MQRTLEELARQEETETVLRDALIQNGFHRLEAELAVQPQQPTFFDTGQMQVEAEQTSRERPDLYLLPPALQQSVRYNEHTGVITVLRVMSQKDRTALALLLRITRGATNPGTHPDRGRFPLHV